MAEDKKPEDMKNVQAEQEKASPEETKKEKIRLVPKEEEQYLPMEVEITCGHCGKSWKASLQQCVNISLHPEEKEQILDFSFLRKKCPFCGENSELSYPLLYDDMGKALMIYLLPENTEEMLAKVNAQQEFWSPDMLKAARICTMRAVRYSIYLVEKIKIFDAELDDRIVELTKNFIFVRFQKERPDVEARNALFEQQNGKNGYTIFAADGKRFWAEIPEGVYEEVERMASPFLDKKPRTEYELIDPIWAHEMLGKILGKSDES